LRDGLPGWISLEQAINKLDEHESWGYYLIRQKRLIISRDPEIGLYLVPNNKKNSKGTTEPSPRKTIITHHTTEVTMKRHRSYDACRPHHNTNTRKSKPPRASCYQSSPRRQFIT
jgi:hypothetical protein